MLADGQHKTVLLTEAVSGLITDTDGIYIDGTFGRGGHAALILSQLSDKGSLVAVDKDPEACKVANKNFSGDATSFRSIGHKNHILTC